MRYFLSVVAILVLANGSARGAIVIDGDIGDWTALGLVHTDPAGDNDDEDGNPGMGAVDITNYGATVIGNTFYAFMQVTRPLDAFDRGPSPGAWINADRNVGTTLQEDGVTPPDLFPAGLIGADINAEIDIPSNHGPFIDVKYWGLDDWAGDAIGTAAGWAAATTTYVMEWSAPVSFRAGSPDVPGIRDALASLPDNVNSIGPWSVTIAGEGRLTDGSGTWGRDLAGLIDVVVFLPGDANTSTTVDVADLTLLLNNYNKSTGMSWATGDFNSDGTVNVTDLTALLNNYNKTVGGSAVVASANTVPEPSSIVMLASLSALLAGWAIRRRGNP